MGTETKTQHTLGPWVADRHGNVWEGSVAPGPTPSQRRNSLRIAVVDQSEGRLSEDAANARLIAAAPELLSEGRALLDWYASLAEPGAIPASLHPVLRSMRAHIAKVEGKS